MPIRNGQFDCPELLAGPNCTRTWLEHLSPQAPILLHTLSAGFGICFIFIMLLICENHAKNSERGSEKADKKSGRKLRWTTLISGAIASLSWMFFVGFGANMEYPLSDPKGEVCILSLLIGNAFLIQSIQCLGVMYSASMNHQLMKKRAFAALSLVTLNRLAVPYILHIMNVTLLIIFLLDWHHILKHPIEVVRLGYGVMSIYILIDTIILPYYLIRLARLLDDISSKGKSRASSDSCNLNQMTETKKVWRALAKKSRRLAYFILTAGPLAISFIVYEVIHKVLTHPHEYFAFQSFWAVMNLIFFMLYIDLLKPHGFLRSSRSQTYQKTSFASNDMDITSYVTHTRAESHGGYSLESPVNTVLTANG